MGREGGFFECQLHLQCIEEGFGCRVKCLSNEFFASNMVLP